MARERGIEIKVGIMVVAAAALLAGFVIVLGNVSFAKGYRFFVDFNFSGNIQSGAPVKISGIKVGKVDEVLFLGGRIDPQTQRRVQVRLKVWVEQRVRDAIRQDADFYINTQGVLGEQYLEIVPGSFGFGCSVFATTATFAPSCAARFAIARPMPREAPVMKRVFPLRLMGISCRTRRSF